MIIRSMIFFILIMACLLSAPAQVKIIPVAHAHNDYLHKHPLRDALQNGFFSVEADIFYRSGKFLVAHTVFGIRKKKTLEQLYLQPLQEMAAKNNGKVYADGALEFELMIDTKGNWTAAQLRELETALLQYENLFTTYRHNIPQRGAVKVLLSGSGNINVVKDDNPRLFSVDAGMGEISSALDSNIICRNSAPYKSFFSWKGKGEMPEAEKQTLLKLCNDAKLHGRKLRFWACPHNENVWRELLHVGAGWVNIDKLKKFRKFYWEQYVSTSKQN